MSRDDDGSQTPTSRAKVAVSNRAATKYWWSSARTRRSPPWEREERTPLTAPMQRRPALPSELPQDVDEHGGRRRHRMRRLHESPSTPPNPSAETRAGSATSEGLRTAARRVAARDLRSRTVPDQRQASSTPTAQVIRSCEFVSHAATLVRSTYNSARQPKPAAASVTRALAT